MFMGLQVLTRCLLLSHSCCSWAQLSLYSYLNYSKLLPPISDVIGGRHDPTMLSTIGELQVPVIMMHMRGTPQTMSTKEFTEYKSGDCIAEIAAGVSLKTILWQTSFSLALNLNSVIVSKPLPLHGLYISLLNVELNQQLSVADAIMPRWMQLVDPGIGFAKGALHMPLMLMRAFLSLNRLYSCSLPLSPSLSIYLSLSISRSVCQYIYSLLCFFYVMLVCQHLCLSICLLPSPLLSLSHSLPTRIFFLCVCMSLLISRSVNFPLPVSTSCIVSWSPCMRTRYTFLLS